MNYNFATRQEPLCGWDWLRDHQEDVTWEDFYNQKLEISSDRRTVSISARLTKKKDIRQIIKG